MIARLKAWLATLWALIRAKSKTLLGALVMLLPVVIDHRDDIMNVVTGYGASHSWAPWVVSLIGFALICVGRVAVELRLQAAQDKGAG